MDPKLGNVLMPAFSASGDLVLLGDGVFRTVDGVRTAKLPALSRLGEASPLALSADGRRVIASAYGRAALFDVATPGMTAILGPPLHSDHRLDPIWTLAISRGSVLAVATAGVVFGIRVAPQFEESPTPWSIVAGDSAFVGDISDDGRWASAAGDNRVLYSAVDGRLAWPSRLPSANVDSAGTQLRMSPQGNWAAGASYEGTMDVFALGDATRMPWLPVSVLPMGCQEAAAFSRDEKMLATSRPSLYRFDATTADKWQPVWSHPSNSAPPVFPGLGNWLTDVRFSPDETALVVSHCDHVLPANCAATLYKAATGEVIQTLADLTAPRPSFSPDGSWIVAGAKLLHLPSGDTRSLDSSLPLTAAVFTPEGDIVVGAANVVLARYCRDR